MEPVQLQDPATLRGRDMAEIWRDSKLGSSGGSSIALSRLFKNQKRLAFLQWACSQGDSLTRCTLAGGFAPMRNSSYKDHGS